MKLKDKMHFVYDDRIRMNSADLSKIPAFKDGKGNVIYWNSLTKKLAKDIWNHALKMYDKYKPGSIGEQQASTILGTLEDTYPEWVEEFESKQ